MSKNIFGFLRSEKFLFSCWIVFCFFISTSLFAPGQDDNDTDSLIVESLSPFTKNWHSPLLVSALRWGTMMRPQLGPYDQIFLFTFITFWLAIALISYSYFDRLAKQCCMAGLAGFFPPTILLLIGDNKDSIMAASILFAFGLLLCAEKSENRNARLGFLSAGAIALLIVTGERHNAIVAVAPLCIWLASIFAKTLFPNRTTASYKAIIAGIILSITFLLSNHFVEEKLFSSIETYPSQMLMYWDLLAVSVREDKSYLPILDPSTNALSFEDLKGRFVEWSCDPLFWPDSVGRRIYFVYDEERFTTLKFFWIQTIFNHPSSYLEHRIQAFLSLLGILNTNHQIVPHFYLMYEHAKNNSQPSPFLHSSADQLLRRYIPAARLPWVPPLITSGAPAFLFLSLYLLGCAFKRWAPFQGEPYLVSSAWLYVLAFFFISVGSNQRYMTYPISVSGLLLARILLATRYTFSSSYSVEK